MKRLKISDFFYLLFTLLLFQLATPSYAIINFPDAAFPELAVSGRATAMGNAFICKTDDSAAAFYNPAGLGTVRDWHFHLSNAHFEGSKGWADMVKSDGGMELFGNIYDSFSIDKTRGMLFDNRGLVSFGRAQAAPNFTSRYLSLGYLFSKQTLVTIDNSDDALFEYADRLDMGPYLAFNISIAGGIIKFGATGLLLLRQEAIGESDPTQVLNLTSDDYNTGTMPMVITGARITLPATFLPTIAATLHNTLDASFSGGTAPTKIEQNMVLGASITPQIGKRARLHLEVNWKDFYNNYSDVDMQRKIQFGAELDFSRRVFFRVGWGDGFGSGGVGIKSKALEVDLTTYAVDTKTNSYKGYEDRRYSLSFSKGF